MMKKNIFISILVICLMLLSSCSESTGTLSPTPELSFEETAMKTTPEGSFPETTEISVPSATPTPPKKEKITRKEVRELWKYETIERGVLSYDEAVRIFGVEGYYVGEETYYPEYQWDLDTGEYVYFRCTTITQGKEKITCIVSGSPRYESYSVKDMPDFFEVDTISYEDCEKIEKGMLYSEVLEILGEPIYYRGPGSSTTCLFEWKLEDERYFWCFVYTPLDYRLNGFNGIGTSEVESIDIRDFSDRDREFVAKQLFGE